MTPPTILAVEDNPITLKMVRVTLESEGYRVLVAPDGRTALELAVTHRPDLILQDLGLPDIDGFELVKKLRALPAIADIPILAFSGFLERMEQAQGFQHGFTDFLFKPLEPSRLLETIRAYAPPSGGDRKGIGRGRQILVADDNPIQLKLLKLRLEQLGFRVATAKDGTEALEQARLSPPAAVISDVLMPGLDGFQLCWAIRKEPRLRQIPVVLTTASFTEEADRELARTVGASSLVVRTPDHQEVVDVLRTALRKRPSPGPAHSVELPTEEYSRRILRQLERQASSNLDLTNRLARREAELAVLAGFTEALSNGVLIESGMDEVLRRCLDAAGSSSGALYLLDPHGGLSLQAQSGYPVSVQEFFAHADLLHRVIQGGEPVVVPSPSVQGHHAAEILERAKARSLLITPVGFGAERLGVLVFASNSREFSYEWIPFVKGLAGQIGHSVVLLKAFRQMDEAQQALERVLSSSPVAIYTLAIAGETFSMTWVSANITMIFGYDAEEALATNWWMDHIHPEYQASVPANHATLLSHGHLVHEYRFQRKDGTYRWVRDEQRLLRDAAGHPAEIVGSWADITERRQMEATLRQNEKLATMGTLLAGVAHELNNPLSVVTGRAALLCQEVGAGPLGEQATKIAQAGERCARIVRNFLALARQQPPDRRHTILNQVVLEAVELLAYPLRVDSVEVNPDLATDLPILWADPHQLHQVVVNLITNAHHAMRETAPPRRLTITTRFDPARDWVSLAVADTGSGVPQEIQSQIFEPFFSTKPLGQGTGLGLPLCKGIIEEHGGAIRLESQPGRGAALIVELPVQRPPARGPEGNPAKSEAPVRGKRILVVDDEPAVAEVLAEMLSVDRHQVEMAENGAQALEKLRVGSYDLILSDVKMPELDGPGLYREIGRSHPSLCRRFIFITGDSLSRETREYLENSGAPGVGKPFAVEEIRQVVQRVLRAQEGVPTP